MRNRIDIFAALAMHEARRPEDEDRKFLESRGWLPLGKDYKTGRFMWSKVGRFPEPDLTTAEAIALESKPK
jgi:hypothetical protein